MKKLEMDGRIFSARIVENGKAYNRVYVWENKIETLEAFAEAVYNEISSVFPQAYEVYVSAYGSEEAEPIIEISEYDEEFYIFGRRG